MGKITILVILLLAVACVNKPAGYGEPLTIKASTAIGNILKSPDNFNGKTVLVAGQIVEECPTGGWFMLKENAAVIFVNLHPSNIAIPQAVGSTVTVQGVVGKNGPKAEITGKGVEFK